MGGEPWRFLPRDIAELTDDQIIYQYVIPERERAERAERASKGLPPLPDPSEPPEIPTRQRVVEIFTSLGMPLEEANKEYDRQLEATRKMQEGK